MLVEELKPHHVLTFASEELKGLGPTTLHSALSIIKRCFNWGAETDFYENSPIAKLKKPTPRRRETLITPDERAKLLSLATGDFRDLLLFAIDHGVRPGELRLIKAEHVDLASGLVELPPALNKTGKRTGRGRSVWLTEQTSAILQRLIERYPQGPMFRHSRGGEWSKNALCRCFARLREEAKITRPITLYSVRHGYATAGLIAGVDAGTIAASMGHSNPAMLFKTYQHVAAEQSHMKDASERLARASRGDVSRSASDVRAKPKRGK